jgi:DNA-binding NtrC family response regulator
MIQAVRHPMALPAVLLVDGECRSRETVRDAIAQMGFEVRAATTAEHALRSLSQDACGIVVVELNLPGMGGLELIERLRRLHPAIEAIILTSGGDFESAKKALRLDVIDFLGKPCPRSDLEHALNRACGRRRRTMADNSSPSEVALTGSRVPLNEVERVHILAAMKRHQGNRRSVADELGISLRTLYNRLREYKQSVTHQSLPDDIQDATSSDAVLQ